MCHTFQVAWFGCDEKMMWEPASSLPQTLINEFEEGVICKESVVTDPSYGVMTHTLVVTKSSAAEPPHAKQARKSIPTSEPGYVTSPGIIMYPSCK